jgi:hypothetical protein
VFSLLAVQNVLLENSLVVSSIVSQLKGFAHRHRRLTLFILEQSAVHSSRIAKHSVDFARRG